MNENDPFGAVSTQVVPSPEQLRGLTHPTRMRMLGILRSDGPQTATALARALGLNTGTASYHVRQLALHGFIEDDRERGDGRDRWWRARHQSTSTNAGSADSETVAAFNQAVVVTQNQFLQAAVEEEALLPQDWREATTHTDIGAWLTSEQASRVVARVMQVMTEMAADEVEPGTPGAAQFVLQLHAFPRPGKLGQDKT